MAYLVRDPVSIVPAVADAYVLDPRALVDDFTGVVQVAHGPALELARDDEGITRNARDHREHADRFGRERDRPRAGLGVGQP